MEKHKQNTINRFGLLGKDIDYSFSRGYFTEKFKREKTLDCQYENFDLDTIEKVVSLLQDTTIQGLNVTIPYKQAILPYLDRLEGDAAAVGAVNTVAFDADRNPVGHNTDVYGFETALKGVTDILPQKALILGTGGASKAVAYVLKKNDVAIQFVSRSAGTDRLSYEQLDPQTVVDHQLIVNCSPLGTYPNVYEKPNIPYHMIGDKHILFDLIYNPEKTLFLQRGSQQGARIQNGHSMLIHQAEKSWSIWNSNQ